MPCLDELFTRIAQQHLFIETLERRNADSLDFHDVSCWGVRDALEVAYAAGVAKGQAVAKARATRRKKAAEG